MAEKNVIVLKGKITANQLDAWGKKISKATFERLVNYPDSELFISEDVSLEGFYGIGSQVKATFEIK